MFESASRATALCGLSMLAMQVATSPARAQDSTNVETESHGIADIVVTAQKRAENVQDVPVAITAITSQDLENRGVRAVADVTNFAPNVQLGSSAPIVSSSQILTGFIRGIGQNDVSASLEPGVGIYLDGVILARSIGANVDLLDIERIEVLKGPQGTLFGRNTIGGAVSIVTREPSREMEFRAEATGGSRNRVEIRATADLPINERIQSQFSFSKRLQDGYQKILTWPGDTGVTDEYNLNIPRNDSDRRGNTDTWVVRGKLKFELSPDISLLVAGDYAEANEETAPITLLATNVDPTVAAPTYAAVYNTCISAPPAVFEAGGTLAFLGPICDSRGGGVPGAAGLPGLAGYNFTNTPTRLTFGDQFITNDIDETYGNGANSSRVETWSATATLTAQLGGGFAIKSITGYRGVNSLIASDFDGAPMMIGTTVASMRERQISQELQLTADLFDDQLHSVLGAYYFYEKNDNFESAYLSEGLGQFYGPYSNRNRSIAFYTHNGLKLTDRFSVTAGARYTRDSKTFEAGQSDLNLSLLKLGLFTAGQLPDSTDPTRIYPLGTNKDTYTNFSMRLGTEYKLADDVLTYLSYAEGFKSGGYTTRLSIPTPGNVAPQFGPEKARTWEFGIKSRFFDRRAQLNVALFDTTYTDLQVTVVRGISPFIENAGSARIRGAEAELQLVPTDALRLSASVGYLDAKYTELDPSVSFGLDSAFVNTPEWSVSGSVDFDIFEAVGGTVTAHGDYAYKSNQARDAVNTPLLLSGTQNTINANLRWAQAGGRLQLTVGVLNLTDDRFITTGTQVDAVGATSVTYSKPREFYLSARVKF